MKTIIAGSRNFEDLLKMTEELNDIDFEITEVISGDARGADRTGEAWAKINNIPIKKMPADWDRYGRSAGYIRNEDMAKCAEVLIAFWDGESRGTKHMIDIAERLCLKVMIVSV
jgi:hypothetical protein